MSAKNEVFTHSKHLCVSLELRLQLKTGAYAHPLTQLKHASTISDFFLFLNVSHVYLLAVGECISRTFQLGSTYLHFKTMCSLHEILETRHYCSSAETL